VRDETMKKTIIVFALILLPLFSINAQQISSARLTALGGLSTAVSTDIDAIGTNPANLVSLSRGTVAVEFMPFTINTGSDFLSLNLYNQYMGGQLDSTGNTVGKYLTAQDKQDILDAFPGGVGNFRMDLNVRDFGLSIRLLNFALGFAVDEKVGMRTAIPNSPLSFILNGLPWGSTLSMDGIALQTFWYRTYSANYAMRLPDILPAAKNIVSSFEVGIGLKYVTGFSYSSAQVTNTSIYADSINHSFDVNMGVSSTRAGLISRVISKSSKSEVGDTVVNFNPFAPQGTGFGIDLGASARVLSFIKVGISFTDIGSISWSKDVINTTGADTSFSFGGFNPANTTIPGSKSNLDSLNSAFRDYFKNKDSVGSSFSTSLPTKMNIGASINMDELFPEIPGQLTLGVDYHQGFNDQFNNSTTPEFIFGAEWRPIYQIPLRTGLGFGGTYGFRWSVGIGFDFGWDFDIGVGTFNAIAAPNAAKNVAVSLSFFKYRF
jgi:hypothetical protein